MIKNIERREATAEMILIGADAGAYINWAVFLNRLEELANESPPHENSVEFLEQYDNICRVVARVIGG